MHKRPARNAVVLLVLPAAAMADIPAATSLKPQTDWTPVQAAHLLRRAGFGGTPAEVDKLSALGLEGAVQYLVDYDAIPFEIAPPQIDPRLLEPFDRGELRLLSEEERQRVRQERQQLDRAAFEETRLWWIDRMLSTPRPFEEKMTLFWHGHFTSGMREVRNALFMKEQNELLRRHALGNFRDLLLAISRDRAMLVYLDGNRNLRAKPNENYARELMELFTLGVGNYTENDVKAAARAFTGWGFDEDGFIFRARQHDDGVKKFLGREGRFVGEHIIDIILQQPACARFLATKLLKFFVRPDPEKRLVEALAAEIRRQNYELRPVLRTLLASQAFYSDPSMASLIKSPIEIVVGSARMLGTGIEDLQLAQRALGALGQELMQPPNVKGWDGNEEWINTATLFIRYQTVGGLVHGEAGRRDRRPLRERAARLAAAGGASDAPMMMQSAEDDAGPRNDEMLPVSRRVNQRQQPYDAMEAVRRNDLRTAEQVVDYFVAHLLATPLDARKRQVLLNYLNGEANDFTPEARDAARRVEMLLHLVLSTPEFQLN